MSLKSLARQNYVNKSIRNSTNPVGTGISAPVITSIVICDSSYNALDDTALDPAGSYVKLIGTGFLTGCSVYFNNSTVTATFISSTEVRIQTPATTVGAYNIMLFNPTNQGGAIYLNLSVSNAPTYTTASGSLGTYYETANISSAIVATGDTPLTYSLFSGTLPSGATLNSDGTITGTSPVDNGSTTYSFVVNVKDAQNQDATRSFSLTINTDVVTWSTPADATVYTLAGGSPMANISLSAASAAGKSITYTANALPSGVYLSGSTVYGTPDTQGTTNTLLTATAATTNRLATRNVSWVISLGDTYWKYTTLLLNGVTPTTLFINDASLNNAQLTIAGDTKPNNFNPYEEGYYSNYFDGTGDYLTGASNANLAMGTGQYTVEFWICFTSVTNTNEIFRTSTDTTSGRLAIYYSAGSLQLTATGGAGSTSASYTFSAGQWYHVAGSRDGSNNQRLFVNGTLLATSTSTNDYSQTGFTLGAGQGSGNVNGYISNLRVVKGTAIYTASFTPPTAPLTAVSGTSLLTCQSNRLIDNSVNNFAITKNGDVAVSSAAPFVTPTTSSYNTQYSTTFDGNGDYLSLPSNTALQFGSSDFTFEAWVFPTAFSGNGNAIISLDVNGTYYSSLRLGTDGSGNLFMFMSSNGTGWMITPTSGIGTISLGAWQHVAVSKSGTSVKVFVNGVLTTTQTLSSATLMTGTFYFIGYMNAPTSQFFQGQISNLRIIKGTALYTSNFTPSTTPLTAISGTSLLTCQNSTLIDNSTNALTITSVGQAQPIAISPFTMTTSSTTVTSLGSAYFDGTGDSLRLTNNAALGMGTGDFTIEFWMYPTAISNYRQILDTSDGNSAGRLILWVDGGGTLYNLGQSGGARHNTAASAIKINTWTHVVLTRASGTTKFYINGTQSGSNYTDITNYTSTTGTVFIGTNEDGSTYPYQGYLTDWRMVKGTALYTSNFLPPQVPLTAVTNTQLLTCQYNGGSTNNGFVDQSSFNNIITRNGNATQGTFSPYIQTGWSNYFAGTNSDYLTIAASGANTLLDQTGDFTTELWIYWSVMPPAGYDNIYGNNAVNGTYVLGTSNSSTQWSAPYILRLYVTGVGSVIDGNTVLTAGQWYHIAHTRTNNVNRLFVNGVVQTNTYTDATSRTFGSSGTTIARNSNAYVSNFRYVKGTSLYTTSFTPSTTPLTAIANTQVLTCQSNRLIDNSPNNFTITRNGDVSVQAYSPFGGVTSVPKSYSTYFDGSGDYFTVPTNTALAFGTGDFTIEMWVWFNDITGRAEEGLIDTRTTSAGTNQWLIYKQFGTATLSLWTGNANVINGTLPGSKQWIHVAVVRSSGSTKMYINGTQSGSTYTDTNNYVSSGATYVGCWYGTDKPLNGYITNLRLDKGQALYTTTFTPSTTPLTTTSQGATASNVSLLTCQSSTLIDNSPNYFAITAAGNTQPYTFNPFGMTNTTGVSYTPAVNGGSMYFDGTGDKLTVANYPALGFKANDFTIQAWCYTNAASTEQVIMTNGWSSYCPWLIRINGSNQVVLNMSLNGGSWHVNEAVFGTVTVGQWFHVAVTRSSGILRAFFNGVQGYTTDLSTGALYDGSQALTIGGRSDTTAMMNGYISDAQLINGTSLYRANFTPPVAPATPTYTVGSTVAASTLLVNGTSGGIIDYHSTNDLETVGNTQLAPQDPYAGNYYSVYFDGTGDYLTVPNSTNFAFGTGDFTIEFWIRTTDTGGGIIAQSSSGWAITIYSGSFYWQSVYNATNLWNYTATAVLDGKWHHVAFVRSTSTTKLYYDGVQVASNSDTRNYGTTGGVVLIGRDANPADFQGNLSNMRVVKGTAVYTSAFTPPTSPLTTVSGTSLLTFQSNKFIDNSSNNLAFTVTGNTGVQSINPFQQNTGKSLYFDGTGDYLTNTTTNVVDFGTGDFTVEYWVYYTAAINNNFQCHVGDASASTTIAFGTGASGALYATTSTTGYTGSASIVQNVWQYITWVRSSGTLKCYLNGTQVFSGAVSTAFTGIGFGVGGTKTGSFLFAGGYIDDLRITKGYARYTTTFTPPTSLLEVK